MRAARGLSFKVLERRSGRIVTFWRDEEACLGGHGHDEDDVVTLTTTDNDDDGDNKDDGDGDKTKNQDADGRDCGDH